MKLKSALLGATFIGCLTAFAAPATAAPLSAAGSAITRAGDSSDLIVQVQGRRGGGAIRGGGGMRGGGAVMRGGGGRAFAGRGYYGGRRWGGGGISPGAAAGLGIAAGVLGVMGAAAAASADPGPYYAAPAYGGCYITRQPVYDGWGNYRGSRRVRVCE